MATLAEALASALVHHQAGRLAEAEQIYRQVLAADPHQADALHLLGTIAHQLGRHETAVEYVGRAIGLRGDVGFFYNSLGEAYRGWRRTAEAVACYQRALQLDPACAEAHYNLGQALKDLGKLDQSVACYRRTLEVRPDFAEAHNNLGTALSAQGKLEEAVACYRRAAQLKPDFAAAHYNLGHALQGQGKLDAALAAYRRAVELDPGYAEGVANLGAVLHARGQLEEALAWYRRALSLKPDFAEAHTNLGVILHAQGQLEEALACYGRALSLQPDLVVAHTNLGIALQDLGRAEEAAACHRRAINLKPDSAEAHKNLGNALNQQGKLDEALACYRRAVELAPDYAEAHNNVGHVLKERGELDQALAFYRRALELEPDFAQAHLNLGVAQLLAGDWRAGWQEYQWRWRIKGATPRRFAQPAWSGQPLAGKTLLIYAEQGFGDAFQFVRFAAVVKRQGATVIVEAPRPLLRVLAGCPGVDRLIGVGDELPAFDFHVPLLSVPSILQTTHETIPATVPYLFPDPALVAQWRRRLGAQDGFKIGIAWQGNPSYSNDRSRSMALQCFAPVAAVAGVRLLSLQKGLGAEQLAEVRDIFEVTDFAGELDQQSGPFMDTAALMKGLDLVIASETAVAHLAGALGVSVWVALPLVPNWPWLLDRSDSPWYPTARLFRQRRLGDWSGVFDEMAAALRQRILPAGCEGREGGREGG